MDLVGLSSTLDNADLRTWWLVVELERESCLLGVTLPRVGESGRELVEAVLLRRWRVGDPADCRREGTRAGRVARRKSVSLAVGGGVSVPRDGL